MTGRGRAWAALAWSGVAIGIGMVPGAAAAARQAVVIRVAPDGRDAAVDGTVPPQPVATLDNALDIVAGLRSADATRPITVDLAPGTWRLDHPLRIDGRHGGTLATPLVIRGAPHGASVLTGSVALNPVATALPADATARLPDAARGHVKAFRLPPRALASRSVGEVSLLRSRPTRASLEVYDQDGALPPARWPDSGWAAIETGSLPPAPPTFRIAEAPARSLSNEPDLWAEGYFRFDWLYETVPVGRIDPVSGLVTLRTPPDEGVIKAGARVRLSHALGLLDRPGRWWRDWERGLLLAWPRQADASLEVAVAEQLLVLEEVQHVRIENLTLTHSLGDAVLVHDGEDVTLAHDTIAWVAGRGAVFENAMRSGLDDCTISQTGRAGVRLIGGDRATLKGSGLFLRRSRLDNYARLALTQQVGAEIDGVGVSIEHNLFRDAGAAGIAIHGNDHRVIGNELTRLLSGATDNGAIYAGRDWTSRGTVMVGNYLHDIRPDLGFETKGIYLDDEASGFTMTRNLFVRVDQPVFIGGGRDNVVDGNVFVASTPAMHVDSRGETWATSAISDPDSELRAAFKAVPVGSSLWRARYPGLARTMTDDPAVGKNNRLVGNTVVLSEPFDFSDGGHRDRQIIAGNHGPEGLRLASGADLAQAAAESRDPRVWAGLVDAQGKPVGLDLAAVLGAGPAAPPRH